MTKGHPTVLAELNAINQEISVFAQTYPTIARWLGGRYEAFRKNNAIYLTMVAEKSMALYQEHVEMDEHGFKHQNKITEQGEQRMPVFIDGLHEKAFMDGWSKLMAKPCSIIL